MFNVSDLYTHSKEPLKRGTNVSELDDNARLKFISNMISDHYNSEFYNKGVTAYNYFNNNADINNKKRYTVGRNGERIESKLLANTKDNKTIYTN